MGLANIDNLSDKLFNKNSYELRNYYNNQKINIDVLEFIYSRLNYLNKKLFLNINNIIILLE
jgi:hypothetical protein